MKKIVMMTYFKDEKSKRKVQKKVAKIRPKMSDSAYLQTLIAKDQE